jgi:hypothetical protein
MIKYNSQLLPLNSLCALQSFSVIYNYPTDFLLASKQFFHLCSMNNPVTIEIKRNDSSWDLIEIMPVWVEHNDVYIPNGSYHLCQGYPFEDSERYDAETMRERYMEHFETERENHPGYLGMLHFKGVGFFEWKYEGNQLIESEVWQLIDCIQDHMSGKIYTTENGILSQTGHSGAIDHLIPE